MYTREQLGVCGIRIVRELAFLARSSDTWKPCTVARPQVASLRFNLISVRFVAGLRRSLRLQYVMKSVNNHSFFAEECTPVPPPYLVSPVRAASAVGSAAGSTSGAAPGSAAGSAAGSSERISMLRRSSGFENFANVGGLQSSSDARNQQRAEHTQQPARAVNVLLHAPFRKRKERVPPVSTSLCAIVEASRRHQQQ